MSYTEILNKRSSRNRFAVLTGCVVKEVSEGKAVVEHVVSDSSLNPSDAVHGGLLFTMADIAAGNAASAYGDVSTTVNSSFSFLRPAINSKVLTATATEIKHGKRLMVFNVEVEDQNGVILATGTFTYMPLGKPIE